jgi:hypothetical protein
VTNTNHPQKAANALSVWHEKVALLDNVRRKTKGVNIADAKVKIAQPEREVDEALDAYNSPANSVRSLGVTAPLGPFDGASRLPSIEGPRWGIPTWRGDQWEC